MHLQPLICIKIMLIVPFRYLFGTLLVPKIATGSRPWVVGVEVPGDGIGEGWLGRAAGFVPLERCGEGGEDIDIGGVMP